MGGMTMNKTTGFASLHDELSWRGLVYQETDPGLAKALEKPLTFYVGFDPTSDSLHLGSMLPLVTMKRLQQYGHKPLFLVGGATGMIGDPSGKTQERVLLTREAISQNVSGIRKVAERFLTFQGPTAATIVNNMDWIGAMSCIDFLRDVGKHFSVNMMLGKESVKGRLESRDHGISYTEFSYMILQSYDFYHLQKEFDCNLQLGGSDQWGNITAGIDLIRRMHAAEGEEKVHSQVYGLTWPLVMKTDGTKFGKSEAGNVWLDGVRTTAYQFYQYLLQTPDADVIRFLKFFSFRSKPEIEALENLVKTQPEKREAQRELARELTAMVHGPSEVTAVETASLALFSGDLKSLSAGQVKDAFQEAPRTEKTKSALASGIALVDLLVETQLCQSKGAARKDIQSGGIYVNNERVGDAAASLNESDLLAGSTIVLRKGKKTYHLVVFG